MLACCSWSCRAHAITYKPQKRRRLRMRVPLAASMHHHVCVNVMTPRSVFGLSPRAEPPSAAIHPRNDVMAATARPLPMCVSRLRLHPTCLRLAAVRLCLPHPALPASTVTRQLTLAPASLAARAMSNWPLASLLTAVTPLLAPGGPSPAGLKRHPLTPRLLIPG